MPLLSIKRHDVNSSVMFLYLSAAVSHGFLKWNAYKFRFMDEAGTNQNFCVMELFTYDLNESHQSQYAKWYP